MSKTEEWDYPPESRAYREQIRQAPQPSLAKRAARGYIRGHLRVLAFMFKAIVGAFCAIVLIVLFILMKGFVSPT
jgi:hypothetical protein